MQKYPWTTNRKVILFMEVNKHYKTVLKILDVGSHCVLCEMWFSY